MSNYRFKLEKSSRKHQCPQCGKKRFVRFIDTITGGYLPDHYGRCDREVNCGYFLNPYTDYYIQPLLDADKENITELPKKRPVIQVPVQQTPTPVFFDFETFKNTLGNYDQNTFIQNLISRVPFPFSSDEVTKVIQLYGLGTVAKGYRAGAITFPFIDIEGNVRAVQVKQFDEQNHTTGADFLHSIIEKYYKEKELPLPEWLREYIQQDKRISCLFGEHLLKIYPHNPVALVEAPKTAIYGSLYFGMPDDTGKLLWLAVYNKSSFSLDKLKALQGRNVIVFPDLSKDGSTYNEWQLKAKDFESRMPGIRFVFSDLLEQFAPQQDRQEGHDLADFLIKMDWRPFRRKESKKYEDYTREERLLFGLNHFKIEDLQQLVKDIFKAEKHLSGEVIQNYLEQNEGLTGNDVPDLMDILCIHQLMKATNYPNYYLN
ncbi:DUF6371 domain-containing protein [Chryseobacterium taklimakanense]|uniref:DUF6371 domain-containing protein n=1 Tax=Chryseobacterium taklimakanense TaxID=536441 RepID=UPI001EF672A1|nr:DUF6371 domain-containing protein [Chryseobacterium taklimakanense]MCG7281761.1 DUF6371 domain-containing protein [Chryseobacterium taklimakanense]